MRKACIVLTALMFVGVAPAVTPPKYALGFNLGDDYKVANYTQLEAYWKKLAAESDRMKLVDIGITAEGRRQYMAIVSSPENIRNLDGGMQSWAAQGRDVVSENRQPARVL